MSTTLSGPYDGVILAAGRGTRMSPFSERYPKPLLPILNKPLIHHHIEYLRSLGVKNVFVVIGHLGHEIAQSLGRGEALGVQIQYVEQSDSLGIAHAVMQLERLIHRPFALLLGDIYFEMAPGIDPFASMLKHSAAGFLTVMKEPLTHVIQRNFTVQMDEVGVVHRVVEKPRFPRSQWKGCGLYAFDVSFFDAVRRTPRTAGRNEYEITDAIQIFIDDGARVIADAIVKDDINLTFAYDLLLANLHALRSSGARSLIAPDAQVDASATLDQCVVGSRARVGPSASLRRTVVFPDSIVTSREPIDRAIITPDLFVDCRYWIDETGCIADSSDDQHRSGTVSSPAASERMP